MKEQQPTTEKNKKQRKGKWQRPEVKQLQVSLDTAFTSGSVTDGVDGSFLV